MENTREEQRKAALAQVKAVYDDQAAEINGRTYKYTGTTHATRKKIFAFFSSIQQESGASNFSFLDSPRFEQIEKLINNIVTYEGDLISKIPGHWDECPEDYVKFVTTSLGVISYPFLRGSLSV